MKARIEARFMLEQAWGLTRPSDRFVIPRYRLREYLPSIPVIVDCRANNGSDSIELARIFPQASIHAIEPMPPVFANLKRNTRRYPRIHCHELALSDQTGSASMYVSSGASDGSSSLLAPSDHLESHPDVHFEKQIRVNTQTLDDWARSMKIAKVDLLWLDMQGFEYRMLAASTVIFPQVAAVHTEVSINEAYHQSVLYQEFKDWMAGKGFQVVAEAIPDYSDMGNVLFVRGIPTAVSK